jgi:glycosyltransferase involved in cell wall biosynthesis
MAVKQECALKTEAESRTDANRRHRLLIVSSHMVPYAEPLLQLMAQHPKLDIRVVHCLRKPINDSEFAQVAASHAALADQYSNIRIRNLSLRPGLGRFLGLINFGLWNLIREGRFDAVAVHGYAYMSFWIAFFAAKTVRTPTLISTDATHLRHPSGGWWWKRWIKPAALRLIYGRLFDIVLVPSTASWQFMRRLGVPEERLMLTPFVADNDYFARHATPSTRQLMREQLSISEGAFVILYCGHLVRWKRPADLLRAFASFIHQCPKARSVAYVLFAGDGNLRRALEAEVRSMNLNERIRFLGFVPYSKLPAVYAASDVLVLPSEHEAWGVVVNEAMASGVPAVVSDRVGAKLDLVTPGVTGESFPVADVQALASVLRRLFLNGDRTRKMGKVARRRIATWSYRQNLQGWVRALERIRQSQPTSALGSFDREDTIR